MSWVVGTRKNKRKLVREGPKFYTIAVLRRFLELSRSPVDRAAYSRMLQLVEAEKFDEFKGMAGSIGIVDSEAIAMLKLAHILEANLTWLDAETKVGGKAAYAKKINAAFSALAKGISFQGKWEMFSSHLIRKASRLYGWS